MRNSSTIEIPEPENDSSAWGEADAFRGAVYALKLEGAGLNGAAAAVGIDGLGERRLQAVRGLAVAVPLLLVVPGLDAPETRHTTDPKGTRFLLEPHPINETATLWQKGHASTH